MEDDQNSIFDKLKNYHIDVNRSMRLIKILDQKLVAKDQQLEKRQNQHLQKTKQNLQLLKTTKDKSFIHQLNNQFKEIQKLQTMVYGLSKEKLQIAQNLAQDIAQCHKLTEEQCQMLQKKLNKEKGSIKNLARLKVKQRLQNQQQNPQIKVQIKKQQIKGKINERISGVIKNKQKKKQECQTNKQNENQKYCYCQQACYGQMVLCQNTFCSREWFHRQCIQDVDLPQKWYCKQCKESVQKYNRKKSIQEYINFGIK